MELSAGLGYTTFFRGGHTALEEHFSHHKKGNENDQAYHAPVSFATRVFFTTMSRFPPALSPGRVRCIERSGYDDRVSHHGPREPIVRNGPLDSLTQKMTMRPEERCYAI